jgi:hypothetical protein
MRTQMSNVTACFCASLCMWHGTLCPFRGIVIAGKEETALLGCLQSSETFAVQGENARLRAAAQDTALEEQLAFTQERYKEEAAERRAAANAAAVARADAAASSQRAAAAEDAAAAAKEDAVAHCAAAADKARAADEVHGSATARIAAAERAAEDAQEALEVKKALLESSAEQIAELRVELEEANQCASAMCWTVL